MREIHHLSQNNVEYEDSPARKMAKDALRNSYDLLYTLGKNKHHGEGKVKHEISQAFPGFPRIFYDLNLMCNKTSKMKYLSKNALFSLYHLCQKSK